MVAVQSAGPYLFELTHEDTKIEYIPGTRDGRPKLNYSGPMGRYSFEGDEIQTYKGARGLEISVTLDARLAPAHEHADRLRPGHRARRQRRAELPHRRHALHAPARRSRGPASRCPPSRSSSRAWRATSPTSRARRSCSEPRLRAWATRPASCRSAGSAPRSTRARRRRSRSRTSSTRDRPVRRRRACAARPGASAPAGAPARARRAGADRSGTCGETAGDLTVIGVMGLSTRTPELPKGFCLHRTFPRPGAA